MRKTMKCLRDSLVSYSAQSGIKGFNFLSSAQSRVEQILWIIALISASILTTMDVMSSIRTYQSGATVTSLKVKAQVPVELSGLKICILWKIQNLATANTTEDDLAELIKHLRENSTRNLTEFTTEVKSDLRRLNLDQIVSANIPTALVAKITQFELVTGKAEVAFKLFSKLFPQAETQFQSIVKEIAMAHWSLMNLTVINEPISKSTEINHQKPKSFVTWLGAALDDHIQSCFEIDEDILKFYDRTSRVIVTFSHGKVFIDQVKLAFYLGPSPLVGLEAENLFFPPIGYQQSLSIRQVGHYLTKPNNEMKCSLEGISFSACQFHSFTQALNNRYNCSPMISSFLNVPPLPLCQHNRLTDYWSHANRRPIKSYECLKSCERRLFIVDNYIQSNSQNRTELKIDLASFVYPQFDEHLAMDFPIFLSRLGGNLSLWLGSSFIVLLHSAIFFIRIPFESNSKLIDNSMSSLNDPSEAEIQRLILLLKQPSVLNAIKAINNVETNVRSVRLSALNN